MPRRSLNSSLDRARNRVLEFTEKTFRQDKMNNWLGTLLLAGMAIAMACFFVKDTVLALGIFASMVGIFFLVVCFTNVEIGFYALMIVSFFIYFINSFFFNYSFQPGILFDGIVFVNFIGLVVSRRDLRESWSQFIKNPLVLYILLRFFYDVVEMFNPNSGGASATSLQGVRKFTEYNLILFTAYTLFDSYERVHKIIFALFICTALCALYGCIQQWHGLFPFELAPIMADPHAFGLLFQNGEFKKWGTMSDPSTFGIVMAAAAVFFLILGVHEKDRTRKYLFIGGSLLMILGSGYSGTRTAYAALLAGIFFFILLNFDRPEIRKFAVVCGVVFLALMFGPFSGISTVRRFRSTFVGSQDESFKVRALSRAFIQPYIYSHPIGGGLGTTGFNGAIEHPGHPLANFQPDSSYVTKAAETGWIGLATILILYFWTLKVAVHGFFQVKEERIKIYYSACASSLFAFYIAEFAQVAIGGISDVVLYFSMVAIILKLKHFEKGNSLATH